MLAFAVMQEAIEHADDLIGGVGIPVGIGGLVVVVLRLGISIADKRATVCEARDARCTTALETCTGFSRELTAEVRRNNDDGRRHIDGRFDSVDRSLAEITLHIRRSP